MAEIKSGVWKYFELVAAGTKTKCILCSVQLSYKGGGTSSMWKHLKNKHPSTASKSLQTTSAVPTTYRQKSIEGHIRRPISKSAYEAYTEMAALVCVKDLRPLSVFEGEGLRSFCLTLNPSYNPPSHKTIRKYIMNMYEECKNDLMSKIEGKSIALTTDMWTSPGGMGFITVTGHYITDDWKIANIMLATRDLGDRHTAENIAEALINLAKEFKLAEVVGITTDNAANMDLACRTAGIKRVKCFAHTLQLAVNAGLALAPLNNLIIHARKLIAFFSKSIPASNHLREHQRKLGKVQRGVVSDVQTRWNSTFFMLERLHIIKADIYAVLNDPSFTKHKHLNLKESHWMLVEQMLPVLKPLVSATEVLCTEEYPSCGSVYPLIYGLLGKHLHPSDLDSGIVRDFKQVVSEGLKKRLTSETDAFHLSLNMMCSVLDPQFKRLRFLPDVKRQETYDTVQGLLCTSAEVEEDDTQGNEGTQDDDITSDGETLPQVKVEPEEPEESEEPFPKKQKTDHNNVLKFLMGDIIEIDDSTDESLKGEFKSYLADPMKGNQMSTLAWWKENCYRYPNVSKFAKRYLCIPATSVPSERAFSTAGLTITKQRSSLESDIADAIIFLNKNLKSQNKVSNEKALPVMHIKSEPAWSQRATIVPNSNETKNTPELPELPSLQVESQE